MDVKKIFGRTKLIALSLLIIFLILPSTNKSQSKSPYKIKTIVIDAGHGGHDSGARGRETLEKHIALQVALKLGKLIESELPGVKVLYTRKTDEFVELYKRIYYANDNHADLFISIHCNSGGISRVTTRNRKGKRVTSSVTNSSAKGTETLVSGYGRLGEQDAALRENASLLLESNYKDNYQGFDPKDPESYIVFSLMKNQFRDQSIKLASYMQNEYVKSGRTNRGVWEKSLAVLARAGMPAVLTEIGFISNPDEEQFMMSDSGQNEIINNLLNAIKTYKRSVER
ncbi:N-acetylmuramoyl-L-alanine amidase family protein [Sphingobacterium spiritivorum]|uniref:N-acetylmuramoyl-L-alanine amidase n=1 Tax=Sphingobacterium spiritivorum ATCC 33861 TaxID=525373 RepID=D7VGL0_SPHSI|nr:N-acetylmuramoyl-L-alanine amidase [Sphingobacterium spiritivorum]EFK59212.1 N-acetylmuramoyl-L-alanine amidase [Sphingobacterium spiritivorum ATCC 33861]QQT34083.1 N-acetylmuramoyl-L-alanine amidase [Sphingobacterium spiritivorum]WQD34913.1 N-acetylmuramoyl-L-alanine amidase [Sphingobacterium spiritivorum]SUI98644.1 N-acetylmuramoyl-L-alanine amidase AmiC precursor [Sphingobacterium spiritivorum]